MRLAVSNIAWDVAEDEAIATLLRRFGVDAIDIAPGKYFPDPANATDDEIAAVKNWWSEQDIEITGMQALLFGTSGLNVFGSEDVQNAMLQHLSAVCRIGAGLGARRLVFGSPKNRDRTGLNDHQAMALAVSFFQRLGDIAQSFGVVVCLEPNPSCYGANFMTTSAGTAQIVVEVAHPSIRMQLDTGALTINEEDPGQVIEQFHSLIGHVHASEPNLVTLGEGNTDHERMATAVRNTLPEHTVSIEMLPPKNGQPLVAVERALVIALKHYA